jgi:hypothetical protein
MRKKASAGIPVLGTVAHFLPTLSMMKPAGKIIVKTGARNREERAYLLAADSGNSGVKSLVDN